MVEFNANFSSISVLRLNQVLWVLGLAVHSPQLYLLCDLQSSMFAVDSLADPQLRQQQGMLLRQVKGALEDQVSGWDND